MAETKSEVHNVSKKSDAEHINEKTHVETAWKERKGGGVLMLGSSAGALLPGWGIYIVYF